MYIINSIIIEVSFRPILLGVRNFLFIYLFICIYYVLYYFLDIRLNNGRETRALNSLGNDLEMSNVHFKAPAEYCRLFTLIDRCIIKLYRDWVRLFTTNIYVLSDTFIIIRNEKV